ncbi:MAG TPA: NUDIX domain-containing protein [Candidatus Saccharimonadales bacterium]|nr:NUDIX domain-containing protein [Candidatus Saccharimonadales bacterium]
MKLLCEIRHSEIVPNAKDKDSTGFGERHAARAIVTGGNGRVALLHVGKYNYHKLPGGGVENNEDIKQALERELLEEIGCRAEITDELGEIIEYRDEWNQKQTSYCYLAKQVGEMNRPDFTGKELSEGVALVWAKDTADAINLLEQDAPDDYGGKFIHERDLTFLKAAHTYIRYMHGLPYAENLPIN